MLDRLLKQSSTFFVAWLVIHTMIAEADQIVVQIEGASDKGKIHLALCDSESNYKEVVQDDGDPFKSTIVKSKEDGITYVFENVKPGNYALLAYHDENSNGKFDKKLWPLEKYGFSQNIQVKFRAPRWKEVRFEVESKAKTLKVKLFHYSLF